MTAGKPEKPEKPGKPGKPGKPERERENKTKTTYLDDTGSGKRPGLKGSNSLQKRISPATKKMTTTTKSHH